MLRAQILKDLEILQLAAIEESGWNEPRDTRPWRLTLKKWSDIRVLVYLEGDVNDSSLDFSRETRRREVSSKRRRRPFFGAGFYSGPSYSCREETRGQRHFSLAG